MVDQPQAEGTFPVQTKLYLSGSIRLGGREAAI